MLIKKSKSKKKGYTLPEILITSIIMGILTLIMVQIMLSISKYNKKAGYIQEADIKTKEIGIKIERLLYNKEFLFIKTINQKILCIYDIDNNQERTYVEFYYPLVEIKKSYYRRIRVFYPNQRNTIYLPENIIWKIEDNFVLNDKRQYTIQYLYNFQDNNGIIKIISQGGNKQKKTDNILFQNLSIGFYVYSSDYKGRKFSSYIKNPSSSYKPKGMLTYFINIININISN